MDTAALADEYARDGYVRIRQFLSGQELVEARFELERYVREIAPNLQSHDCTMEADGKTVRNLWRMEQHDPFFRSLGQRKPILDLARRLVHGDPVLMAVETFNKPARVGSGVPPHQDNAYFCQTPPDVLTIWIALDAATPENGPISYLKGSHRGGVLPHRASGVAGNSMGLSKMPQRADGDDFCGTLEAGDAVIHHCQTIHWSAPNKTDRSRCGLLLVYRGAHTTTDARLKEAYDAGRVTA